MKQRSVTAHARCALDASSKSRFFFNAATYREFDAGGTVGVVVKFANAGVVVPVVVSDVQLGDIAPVAPVYLKLNRPNATSVKQAASTSSKSIYFQI